MKEVAGESVNGGFPYYVDLREPGGNGDSIHTSMFS